MTSVTCPECLHVYKVGPERLGNRVVCRCGARFIANEPGALSAEHIATAFAEPDEPRPSSGVVKWAAIIAGLCLFVVGGIIGIVWVVKYKPDSTAMAPNGLDPNLRNEPIQNDSDKLIAANKPNVKKSNKDAGPLAPARPVMIKPPAGLWHPKVKDRLLWLNDAISALPARPVGTTSSTYTVEEIFRREFQEKHGNIK